jgi:uncharacterized small protein (DUF1192 family)
MAEEVYKEEAKTVEELQAEIAALKQELADMKAQSQPADDAAASVVKAMEESTEDKDVKVEMLCRWAAPSPSWPTKSIWSAALPRSMMSN